MSDLDKLMNKLKKPETDEEETQEDVEEEEDDEDYEDDEETEEEVEEMKPLPKKIEKVTDPKPKAETPQETEEGDHTTVEQEVAILQNPAIYRREMLAIQRERNLLLNAIAHILSDALGGKDAKAK